jgi:hypothetical protein
LKIRRSSPRLLKILLSAEDFVGNADLVAYITSISAVSILSTLARAATLNAIDGAIRFNLAIVPIQNGSISAFTSNSTHLVLDIIGDFAP